MIYFKFFNNNRLPYTRISRNIIVGRRLTNSEAKQLRREYNISAILDLTPECSERSSLLDLPYKNIQIMDLTTPAPASLNEAIHFINLHSPKGLIYIHCALGLSRSTCTAAAFLLHEQTVTSPLVAINYLQQQKPDTRLNKRHQLCLKTIYSMKNTC